MRDLQWGCGVWGTCGEVSVALDWLVHCAATFDPANRHADGAYSADIASALVLK